MDEYYEDNTDLDLEEVREDFEYIWSKNIVQVELIREENPVSGDYFNEDEANVIIRRRIWLNIQGVTNSDAYKRITPGVVTTESTLHVYAKWDEDIRNLDVIKFEERTYRIEGFDKSRYAGQIVFQDFDLKRIDHG